MIRLPIRIVSEANRRDHWAVKARRVRAQRMAASMAVMSEITLSPMHVCASNVVITLCRVAPRALDSDNLSSAFKAIRDGVAGGLGLDDGDKRITWRYSQRRGKPREYAVEIDIEIIAIDIAETRVGNTVTQYVAANARVKMA